jgi:hypothetical protein
MGLLGGTAQGAGMGMTFGPWGAVAGGLIGGITSMFSAKSQSDQINENLQRAREQLATGLVSSEEIANRLRGIDRQFNARLTSVLNTTAIRSRGIANKGVVGAAVAGSIEGARMATEVGVVEQSLAENRGIRQAQAQLELAKTNPDMIGSFVEGAAAGVTTGMEVSKMVGGREMPSLGDETQPGGATIAGFGSMPSMQDAGRYNPFLKDQSPRLGNVDDPFSRMPTQSPFIGNIQQGVF